MTSVASAKVPHRQRLRKCLGLGALFGDNFGVSLGGSQALPELLESPRTSQKFPELPRKFLGGFPGTSLTVDFKSIRVIQVVSPCVWEA